MTNVKTIFFVLLAPGFLLSITPLLVIPNIPYLTLPAGS